jgi:hypothetical protein
MRRKELCFPQKKEAQGKIVDNGKEKSGFCV